MKPKSISFVYVLALLLGFQSYIHAQCPSGAVIDQTTLPFPVVGTPYNFQMTVSNFPGSISWSVAPSLPGGLTISASGLISGTPISGSSPSNVTFIAAQTTPVACTRTSVIRFKNECPGLVFSTTTAYTGIISTFVSVSPIISGAATGSCSVSPALPAGLTINSSTGVISGLSSNVFAPTTYTVTAGNGSACTSGTTFTLAITCLPATITLANLPFANVPYSGNIGPSTGVYYNLTPALPAGLSMNSLGNISGTPTAVSPATTYIVNIDIGTCINVHTFSLSASNCVGNITSATPAGAITSTAYSHTFTTSYSTATTFSITPALPVGLTLNASTGVISGSSTSTSASIAYVVRATQTSTGCSVTQNFNFAVVCPTITVSSTIPTSNFQIPSSSPISYTFSTTGGAGAISYALTGVPPTGITLNPSTGVLSGSATVTGIGFFTVTATRGGCTGFIAYNYWICSPFNSISPTTATIPNPLIGISYSQQLTSSYSSPTWSVLPALPAGLTLGGTTGLISGTPTILATSASYVITATEVNGFQVCSTTRTYTFAVACPTASITPTTIPTATINTAYSQQLAQTSVTGTVTWSVSPAFPTGITLDNTGLISGTSTATSVSASYVVTASNGTCSATRTYPFAVNAVPCPTIIISPPSLLAPIINVPYSQQLTQTGLTAPVTWSVAPAFPSGITLGASTGLISGTATALRPNASYIVTVASGTCNADANFIFAVICPTRSITTATIPNATVNVAYNQQLSQTGVTGTVTWSVLPLFPAGITLDGSTGLISGTATAVSASASYVVTATNGTCSATITYPFAVTAVACPTSSITPATIPSGVVSVAYSQQLAQTGLTGTVTWSVSPALPAGIALGASTGLISGTSTAASASASYVVTATNGTCSANITYPFAVNNVSACPTITINPVTLANATAGSAYTATLTATGGTAPYTFNTNGVLPTGLILSSAGVLAGTPATTTTVTFTVTATATGGCVGTKVYTLVISPSLATAIDNSLASLVKVSPNPSNSDFNVDFGSISMAKSVVRVYDAQGKTVFSAENNSNLMIIPLAKFANGIYLMEVETSKGRILKRLAKQ